MKNVVILGSTGSIGTNTLCVLNMHLDIFSVFALTANTQYEKLLNQCIVFKPKYAVILNSNFVDYLKQELKKNNINTIVLSSLEDIVALMKSTDVDIVVSAIVGVAGLTATYTALEYSKTVLLANKESLVVSGKLINQILQTNKKSKLIPIDSEHSAILQCLPPDYKDKIDQIDKLILTASGGPFYGFKHQDLKFVTPEMALKHPNWKMGRKITIDSSTLMNKGLEVIEAFWLFNFSIDKIDIVIHPQSIIHSMVEYCDGSILSQMGMPDMRTSISYALGYPLRIESGSNKVDFSKITSLTFDKPDFINFPCLELAYRSLRNQKASPAVLNAANEVVVQAFLDKKILFYDINTLIEKALNYFENLDYNSITEILEIDKDVRNFTLSLIK